MSSSRFNPFYYTYTSVIACTDACDSNLGADASDNERCKHVWCGECQCVCWPFFFVFDIISCPVRCGHYFYTKKSQLTETETGTDTEIKPTVVRLSDYEKNVYNTQTITIGPTY